MKLQKPQNDNYAAVVVRIKSLVPLEGCDNVVGTPLLGFQAIVGKDTEVGTLGIVFPAETQLSEKFCHHANLFRHGERNANQAAKGYIEDNRRVKAMKFRGHRSDCLFMQLGTLLPFAKMSELEELKEGDIFDAIGGEEICRKYAVKTKSTYNRLEKNKAKKFVRVDAKFLPEHYDSDNYWRNEHAINAETEVIVTQKLHGTSIRIGHTVVARKLNFFEKALKAVGVKVQETEYDYVFGSRKVVKDINNPNHNHFYSTDIWTEEGKKLEGTLPENFILYGELVGWTKENAPIQKNYTYDQPVGTCQLYVYRVAFINAKGMLTDLSWKQCVEFCADRGLKTVPTLAYLSKRDFVPELWIDKRFRNDEGFLQAVPLSDPKTVDEGVCVRVDGMAPYILKAKSPVFLEHETKMLDEESVDLETEGGTV